MPLAWETVERALKKMSGRDSVTTDMRIEELLPDPSLLGDVMGDVSREVGKILAIPGSCFQLTAGQFHAALAAQLASPAPQKGNDGEHEQSSQGHGDQASEQGSTTETDEYAVLPSAAPPRGTRDILMSTAPGRRPSRKTDRGSAKFGDGVLPADLSATVSTADTLTGDQVFTDRLIPDRNSPRGPVSSAGSSESGAGRQYEDRV